MMARAKAVAAFWGKRHIGVSTFLFLGAYK
jgi:hypothetical protein